MLGTSFPPWPSYTEEEISAVSSVLRSNRVNYWTGTEARSFEAEFAEYVGSEYGVALANGTLALDLALRGLGIGEGDEVVVTPRTFIASVSAVVGAGATPVFADVDRDTQNLSASTIEAVLTPSTKAIVVVHLAGMPADMDPIMALAGRHGLKVIEDCAQAHGARYRGKSVGSIGDVGAWSFCQDKIMSTGGEGGMVTTNDEELWRRMWEYKDHGKSWKAVYEDEHPPGFRWLHQSIGTNWRMCEMQAALGRIQISRMPQWQKQRRMNAERIWETCERVDWLRVPRVPDHIEHAAYKAYVFVERDALPAGWTRDDVVTALVEDGIPTYQGSCSEVYLERAFDEIGCRPAAPLPVARELGENSLMFLVHPTLEKRHIDATCTAIETLARQIEDGALKPAVGCE